MLNGTNDTGDQFPYVVGVSQLGPFVPFCSGVLVAPQWVLTAKHCVDGVGNAAVPVGPNTDLTIRAVVGGVPYDRDHTVLRSGPIRLYQPQNIVAGPNDTYGEGDDLALIRLDERMPPSAVPRATLPAGPSNCPDGLNGWVVGWSRNVTKVDGESCPAQPRQRRFASGLNFDRNAESRGSQFVTRFVVPLGADFCNTFVGSMAGDSGGGLFYNGFLCGISAWSEATHLVLSKAFDSGYASVEFSGALNWIKDNIFLDEYWNLGEGLVKDRHPEGACPTILDPSIDDFDNDGVHNACDFCPYVYDPDQLTSVGVVDADGDGHGDVCDPCPGMNNPGGLGQDPGADPAFRSVTNTNLESERSTFLLEMKDQFNVTPNVIYNRPVLTLNTDSDLKPHEFAMSSQVNTAAERLRDLMKPNLCDPVPTPQGGLLSDGYVMSDLVPPGGPTGICPVPFGPNRCRWLVRNRIALDVEQSSELESRTSQPYASDIGLRHCECPKSLTNSLARRRDCEEQEQCKRIATEYDSPGNPGVPPPGSAWQRVVTSGPGQSPHPPPAVGPAPTGPTPTYRVAISPNGDIELDWEFRYLPWLQTNGPESFEVEGLLWLHTTNLIGGPAGGANLVDIRQDARVTGNWYTPGNAHAKWFEGKIPVIRTASRLPSFCLHCPYIRRPLLNDLINPFDPMETITPLGVDVMAGYDAPTLAELRRIEAGEAEAVLAADHFPRAALGTARASALSVAPGTRAALGIFELGEDPEALPVFRALRSPWSPRRPRWAPVTPTAMASAATLPWGDEMPRARRSTLYGASMWRRESGLSSS